jgi:MFS family permease
MKPGAGLWRNPAFRLLWAAGTVSQLGTQVTELALPFVAVAVLHASTFAVGALLALSFLPLLLFGLPAGALVDRRRRRPVMVAADLIRAAILLSVPAAYLLGRLGLGQLFLTAFLNGALSLLFDTASQAYLPHLVRREQLQAANGALQVSEQGASVAGPALGGLLIGLVSAPFAVLADALSYLISAVCLGRIASMEVAPSEGDPGSPSGLFGEMRRGLAYVLRHPYLRPLLMVSALTQFFGRMIMAVLLVYLVREVHLPAGLIGTLFSAGSLGFVLGALAGPRLARAAGLGPTLAGAALVVSVSPLAFALAPRSYAALGVVAWLFVYGVAALTWSVNSLSLRQAVTPAALRGRVGATMQTASWGMIPIASLLGGILGGAIGLRPTIMLGALGTLLAFLPVAFSRVPSLRELPEAA